MQMCTADKDLKREHAVDDVLLSTCTQHQLRLDVQLDLEGGGWGGGGGGGNGFVLRLAIVQLCFSDFFFFLHHSRGSGR